MLLTRMGQRWTGNFQQRQGLKYLFVHATQEMYSEVPVPKSLEGGRSFDFLKRDLRRTGLPSGQPGTPGGGFDSSLHGGYAGAGGSPYGGPMQGSLHGGGGLH